MTSPLISNTSDAFGLYFHIPFCRHKCVYCNFFSLANPKNIDETIKSMRTELAQRAPAWKGKKVRTIYFGGGTPSLLSAEDVFYLLEGTKEYFDIVPHAEITIEANPDDISPEKTSAWASMGINRVSVGIQSFSPSTLEMIGRTHTGETAVKALDILRKGGINNISADIIYGIPQRTDDVLRSDIQRLIDSSVQHISAYALTVEQGTALFSMIAKKKLPQVSDEDAERQYEIVCSMLEKEGVHQYEISNFSRFGFRSQHNSAYWQGIPYLGIGPSAHSYDGENRRWNVSSVGQYVHGVNTGKKYWEEEFLTKNDRHNEFIMTSLRRVEGFSLSFFEEKYGDGAKKRILSIAEKYIDEGLLEQQDGWLRATERGRFFTDGIESDMFLI